MSTPYTTLKATLGTIIIVAILIGAASGVVLMSAAATQLALDHSPWVILVAPAAALAIVWIVHQSSVSIIWVYDELVQSDS